MKLVRLELDSDGQEDRVQVAVDLDQLVGTPIALGLPALGVLGFSRSIVVSPWFVALDCTAGTAAIAA